MSQTFSPVPVLDHVGGVLSIAVMAGLTFASAATWATHHPASAATVVQLPPVVMTVKRAAPVAQLPTVIVVAQRGAANVRA
ncbi:hypothetical protein [Inhella crocodyli]|uniref:Uncharacterized protein n=1 Tax=Inhella crocodyli TaxID=2499851 RepID=A0A437LTA8_9BURK|nr:hypothetical protein [Inhella crocodyli]RVT88655.1 hypothetical protein EOD73_06720 [Inhella crocodyli]